jgi:hypothetical protein
MKNKKHRFLTYAPASTYLQKNNKTQIAIEIELDGHKHEANCSLQSG